MAAVSLSTTELGTGTPVLILHGLFGRKRNWQAIQKRLADDARIVTADMRNHGDSPWSDEMTYEAMAQDIRALIESLDAGPALVVGHSMGGKAAMTLALEEPDAVRGLMVVDIAPVPYSHDYGPYIEAMRKVPVEDLERRNQAEPYLEDEIPDAAVRAFLLQNLGFADDRLTWQVNLNAIEAGMPAILDFPDGVGDPYDGPTMFLSGGNSDYVSEAHMGAIEALVPNAERRIVEGAGHWVHAEKPAEVIAAISDFIEEAE